MFESLQHISFGEGGRGWLLFNGLLVTLQVAFGAYALGLLIGFFGALGKIHGGFVIRTFLEFYTTVFRAVPELVLILLLYYSGQVAFNAVLVSMGFEAIDINGLIAGICVIGVVQGAYSTEVIRAAMLAVPNGQAEAAFAFGMSRPQMLSRIMIPAMLPLALPGLSNLWLICTKDTALLAVVGFTELAATTKASAASTREYLLFYMTAFVIYLCISLLSMRVAKYFEDRYRRGQAAA